MSQGISRREWLTRLSAMAPATFVWQAQARAKAGIPLVVYKDPNCGCCEAWIAHMKANGFTPAVTNTPDMDAVKRARGVPAPLASCHTALVGGYVIEGHVPAPDVKKLLAQKPQGIVGLTIPGMPSSAPGMDMQPFQPYTVLSFDAHGKTMVFAAHSKA
jgi:hypothetical protein